MGLRLRNAISNKIIDWLMHESKPRHQMLSDFKRMAHEIRLGDILLVEGRSRASDVIKLVSQSPWSHAAIYIGRLHDIEDDEIRASITETYHVQNNQQLIIESLLGKGTIITPLDHYKLEHTRICRAKGLSHDDAHTVIHFALSQLGREYDVRHILDLFRFLFPWGIIPRRWRSCLLRHHAGESTRQICSAMLAEAFGAVRFPILPIVKSDEENGVSLHQRNPRLYTPSDFDYSPYFEIIKYPFYRLANSTVYRDLPWHEDGSVADDDGKLIYPTQRPDATGTDH